MSTLIEGLLAQNLKALKPYESARRLYSSESAGDSQQIWLNANESPYSNDYEINPERFNRYPDCQPPTVVNSYAQYAGINKEQLLLSRGADEAIELLIRTFCTPGRDKILICPPTYGMYAISAETCNVGVIKAPLLADFSLDVPAICAHKGKVNLVYICSPNNPTGTTVDKTQLQAVIEHFADSALVIVDEAYIEFDLASNWAMHLAQHPNLVILRTLSKAFALAGLRCGFALASAEIIQAMMKVIAPYPIPEPVAQIAAQALSKQGLLKMSQQVLEIKAQKAKMKLALEDINEIVLVGDDKANFILFRSTKKQALMDHLVANGLLIRDQSKQLNLEHCLRITIGNPQQNEQLLAAIASFFAQQEKSA